MRNLLSIMGALIAVLPNLAVAQTAEPAPVLEAGAYRQVSRDGSHAFYFLPSSLERLANGHLIGWFRSELAAPIVVEGKSLRSVRKLLEVDCGDLRYRELVFEGFARNNLQEAVFGLPTPNDWTKPAPETGTAGMVRRQACNALAERAAQ